MTPPSRDDFSSFSLLAIDDDEYKELDRLLRDHPTIVLDELVIDDADGRLLDKYPSYAPSSQVWDRIVSDIETESAVAESTRSDTTRGVASMRSVRRTRWFVGAVAAAAAVAVVVLGAGAVLFDGSGVDDGDVFAAEAAALLESGDATVVRLADPTTSATAATIVTGTDGASYFIFSDLADLGPDETYQLWAVVDGNVVSAGLLGPTGSAVPVRLEAQPTVLAVTVEKSGGVVVSDQDPVAVWAAEA